MASRIQTDVEFNRAAPTYGDYEEERLRRRRLSWAKLYRQIRLGRGQGHNSNYQPWLQIHKKNSSPDSNQVVTWLPLLNRVAHFFSRGEYHLALLLLWLGVTDLREQYPIWLKRHPHPLRGANGTGHLNGVFVPGLLDIASHAGISNGLEPGTPRPYVATLDILATVPDECMPSLAAFSCKPPSIVAEDARWRTLERLELERRYSGAVSMPYLPCSSSLVPLALASQLESWLDCITLPPSLDQPRLLETFAERISVRTDLCLAESVQHAACRLNIPLDTGWLLFRHCAWSQRIDVDPCATILTSYPIRSGGRALRKSLQFSLFGRTWS